MKKIIIITIVTTIVVLLFFFIGFNLLYRNSLDNLQNKFQENNENTGEVQTKEQEAQDTSKYTISGSIEIPKIDFNSNVYATSSANNLKLGIAILFNSNGSTKLNTEGNTVLIGTGVGENDPLKDSNKLEIGDKIILKDTISENTVTYEIYDIFYTKVDDVDFYTRDTNSKREITITTNNLKSDARIKEDNNPKLLKERLIILAKEI